MKTSILTIMTVFCLGLFLTTSSFAAEESNADLEVCKVGETVQGSFDKADEEVPADYIHWDFITCTRDTYECAYEARYHGFPHYRAIHDHYNCGGYAHYACWGGHH